MTEKEKDLQAGPWKGPNSVASILIMSMLLASAVSAFGSASVSNTILKGQVPGTEHLITFPEGGGLDGSLALAIPGDGPVVNSSLSIGTTGTSPGRVSIDLGIDGRLEWAFGGGRYGSFGEQDMFSDGGPSRRAIPVDGVNLTYLLPRSATVSSASMTARSPPSPEGDDVGDLYDLDSPFLSAEHIDHADLDGVQPNDVVVYSSSGTEILAILRNGGSSSRLLLADNVANLLALRAFSTSPEGPGGVIYSEMAPMGGFQRVCIATVSTDLSVSNIEVASGLRAGAPGFSIRQDGGPPSIHVIDGQKGAILSVDPRWTGTYKHALTGAPGSPTGVSEADLDGDLDRDLLIWSDSGNATFLRNTGSDDSPIYDASDGGISGRISSPGEGIDVDGDGKEEVFVDLGATGSSPAVACLTNGGTLSLTYLGANGTKASIRSLPRSIYGDGGLYDGGEGLLYLTDADGLDHLLPEGSSWGKFITRRSSSFTTFTIVVGTEEAVSISPDGRLSLFNASWSRSTSASITGPNGAGNGVFDPSSSPSLDLSAMVPADAGPYIRDHYDNQFRTSSLSVGSKDGFFVSFSGLSITYSLGIDASSSPAFFPALAKARNTFVPNPVPFSVGASSGGSVKVGPAVIVYDSPPMFTSYMPDRVTVLEGDPSRPVLDLRGCLVDDGIGKLSVGPILDPDLPEGFVRLVEGPILQAYPELYPDLNGEFDIAFEASDGHTAVVSRTIVLEVEPVQDGPAPLHEQVDIFIEEGEARQIDVSSMFHDPEGDPLAYSVDSVSMDPSDMDIDIELVGGDLILSSSVHGRGGTASVWIMAYDDRSDASSRVRITVHLKDIDGPCTIGANPGPLTLREDQGEVAIGLDGWFIDRDSPLSDYVFTSYPSSKLLKAHVDFVGSSPYLFVRPTNDLYGEHHYVWVDASNGAGSIYDKLDVVIKPVNDVPALMIEWSEAGTGSWSLQGIVTDPDSYTGTVKYRIGDGEWRSADGWESFTLHVPFEDLDVSGSYVHIKADDGTDESDEERIKLTIPLPWGLQFIDSDGDGVTDLFDEFPLDPTEVYDTDGDGYGDNSDAFPTNPFEHLDTDGDGYGDNSDAFPDDPTRYKEDVEPPLPGSKRKVGGWIFAAGGAAAVLIGLVVFFAFTEIGVVIVVTAASTIYSKLSTKDVLNHEIRGLIRGYIIANPGDHYSSIKRNLDLNNGTLAYHLRVLEQNGLIKSLYDGVFKRYYPANVNIAKVKKNVSKQEEIFNIILENPGISMEQIGRLIGVSRQVVNYHVKNLIRSGLISYQRDLKSAKFFPTGNGGNGHEGEI